jgi:hypothetical protein
MPNSNEESNFMFASKYGVIGPKLNRFFLCGKKKEAFRNCIANDASDCGEFLEAYKKVCGNEK